MPGIIWKLNGFLRSPVASSRLIAAVNKTLFDVGVPSDSDCWNSPDKELPLNYWNRPDAFGQPVL